MVLELESLNIKTTELQIAVVRLPEVFLENQYHQQALPFYLSGIRENQYSRLGCC